MVGNSKSIFTFALRAAKNSRLSSKTDSVKDVFLFNPILLIVFLHPFQRNLFPIFKYILFNPNPFSLQKASQQGSCKWPAYSSRYLF
jgi:hypothetical protein